MVPAQSRAYGPLPQVDHVFHERRLFQIWTIVGKTQSWRGIRIELIGIGDEMVELLMQKGVVRLDSGFELLIVVVPGIRSLEVAFIEIILLESNDRRREDVGIEIVGIIANESLQRAKAVGREDVCVVDRAQGFEV